MYGKTKSLSPLRQHNLKTIANNRYTHDIGCQYDTQEHPTRILN